VKIGSLGHGNEYPHEGFLHKLNDYQLLTTHYASFVKTGLRIKFGVEIRR
jgi:hypothetical protein